MSIKNQSLQNQIRVNLFRILGVYFFVITLLILLAGIFSITKYQRINLAQYQELIKTKIEADVSSSLRESSSLSTSSFLWTGLTDSAGRDSYLSPLLQRINATNPYKVDLLDYKGRDFIVTESFPLGVRQSLTSVKNTVATDRLNSELLHDETNSYLVIAMPIKAPFSDSSLGVLLIKVDLTKSISSLPLDRDLLVSFNDFGYRNGEILDGITKTKLHNDLKISVANNELGLSVSIAKSLILNMIALVGVLGLLLTGAFFVFLSLKRWSHRFAADTTHRLNELVDVASTAAKGQEYELKERVVNDEIDRVIESIQEIFKQQKITNEKLLISSKVFETAAEAILITNESGNILEVNESLLEITGYSRENLIGKPAGVLYRGDDDSLAAKAIVNELNQKGSWKGETFFITRDRGRIPTLASITTLVDQKGLSLGTVAIFSNISEIKAAQEKLKEQLYVDQLTGLPNFRAFTEFVERRIQSESLRPFVILFIDLDNFKSINDTYGHNQGDEAIIQMARYLEKNLPESAKLFRRSGDEFIAYVDSTKSLADTKNMLSSVLHRISITLGVDVKNTFSCSFSAGGASFPNNSSDVQQLLIYADTALQYSKEVGREQTTWFDDSVKGKIERKKILEIKLSNAIDKNLIHLNYQPEVNLKTGQVVGFEALARWFDDDLGHISPAEFIPLAEERGLIEGLTNSVLRCLNRDLDVVLSRFPEAKISFNASPKLFKDQLLYRLLIKSLGDSRYLKNMVLEITESEEIQSSTTALAQLNSIIQMGIEVAIDDFGKGFSSLSRLSVMPIHKLKIDSSFLFDYKSNNGKKIIESIIGLSHALGLDITAEGVESQEQVDLLVSLGCAKAQGYFFSKPISLDELTKLHSRINPSLS